MSTRHNVLLFGGWREFGAFIDDKVQTVIEVRRQPAALAELSPEDRELALAWPVLVYDAVNTFCERPGEAHASDSLAYFYADDPTFVAAVLSALTEYHNLPEGEWPIERVLYEFANISENPKARVKLRQLATDGKPIDHDLIRLLQVASWKTIARVVESTFPRFSKVLTAKKPLEDDIRTKHFPALKAKVDLLRALWDANLRAYWKIDQLNFQDRSTSLRSLKIPSFFSVPQTDIKQGR